MPKVNNKHFPYTATGMKMAAKERMMMKQKEMDKMMNKSANKKAKR